MLSLHAHCHSCQKSILDAYEKHILSRFKGSDQREVCTKGGRENGIRKVYALERGDQCFFIVDLAAILKNNIIPFPLTPARLLVGDQAISNGAAKQFFCPYNPPIHRCYKPDCTNVLVLLTCKKSAKSVAPMLLVLLI
jgi:hypothetical protein